jgi:phosphoribosyl 1,2-cyclic phosphate phosphodiesterase
LRIIFLGTGTSAGIPMIGCRCDVCTSPDPRDRRTRSSVVFADDSTRVLVDATPELRLQCLACDIGHIDAVVFTHAHADHIMGIDDLRRFNAISGRPLDAWMDPVARATIDQCFGYALREPTAQGVFRPQLVPRTIDGPFEIGAMTFRPIPLLHGSARILGFRVGNIAYCTDASGIPDESWTMLEGLDLLVLDALQDVKHPTHFTIDEAIEVVDRVRPRRTLFTHMSHRVMHERDSKRLPAGVEFAYDGMIAEVNE